MIDASYESFRRHDRPVGAELALLVLEVVEHSHSDSYIPHGGCFSIPA